MIYDNILRLLNVIYPERIVVAEGLYINKKAFAGRGFCLTQFIAGETAWKLDFDMPQVEELLQFLRAAARLKEGVSSMDLADIHFELTCQPDHLTLKTKRGWSFATMQTSRAAIMDARSLFARMSSRKVMPAAVSFL